jgi:hypothetical protein
MLPDHLTIVTPEGEVKEYFAKDVAEPVKSPGAEPSPNEPDAGTVAAPEPVAEPEPAAPALTVVPDPEPAEGEAPAPAAEEPTAAEEDSASQESPSTSSEPSEASEPAVVASPGVTAESNDSRASENSDGAGVAGDPSSTGTIDPTNEQAEAPAVVQNAAPVV